MTELEKMKRAKFYIDMLANGIDPLTGVEFESDTILNNVRLSRCFFYVSEVLGRVIDNGGETRTRGSSYEPAFAIEPENIALIEFTEAPVAISVFAKTLSQFRNEGTKSLSATAITNWLLEQGYLVEETHGDKKRRVASAKGKALGILTVDGTSMQGVPYKRNLYNSSAQQFIVMHLKEIAAPAAESVSFGGEPENVG